MEIKDTPPGAERPERGSQTASGQGPSAQGQGHEGGGHSLHITTFLPPGLYPKPSLSAQPGPSVPWGADVTLQCASETRFDTFHLHREGSLDPPQHLRLQNTPAHSQANFTISAVTSGHGGTYRCYGSHSTSPYLLSHPSDPLELRVSGEEPQPCPLCPHGQFRTCPQGPFGLKWE